MGPSLIAAMHAFSSLAHWWQLAWFSKRIRKHTFVAWLAIHNKLTTKDRMVS